MAAFDLVFEGGGAKGSAFVGALEVLAARGHSHRRLIGTSAGAITAALLAAGFTPQEMLDAVNETDASGKPRFASFMDIPPASDFDPATRENSDTLKILKAVRLPGFLSVAENWIGTQFLDALMLLPHYRQLFGFVECGGFFSGDNFVSWLREKLQSKGIADSTTFAGLSKKNGWEAQSSMLSVVVTDTTSHEMLVLNDVTAPDCPLLWAVRMSMSIPFIWREVIWQSAWGKYRSVIKDHNIIVDGGVLSNFPLRLVAEANPDIMATTHEEALAAGSIGLLLDDSAAPKGQTQDPRTPVHLEDQLQIVNRVRRIVDTMTEASDNAAREKYASLVCCLPVKGFGTTEFDMSRERLAILVQSGRDAMTGYLNQHAF